MYEVLTVKEMAKHLKCSKDCVYEWLKIPAMRDTYFTSANKKKYFIIGELFLERIRKL